MGALELWWSCGPVRPTRATRDRGVQPLRYNTPVATINRRSLSFVAVIALVGFAAGIVVVFVETEAERRWMERWGLPVMLAASALSLVVMSRASGRAKSWFWK